MEEKEFDLNEFREHLHQLETQLKNGVKEDPDYQGEADEVLGALKRLKKELQDSKYEKFLPDLFLVLDFLGTVQNAYEDDFEDEEEV